jgi:hypothetical protein
VLSELEEAGYSKEEINSACRASGRIARHPLRLFESEKSPVGALILQVLWEMKEKRRTYRPGSLATKS